MRDKIFIMPALWKRNNRTLISRGIAMCASHVRYYSLHETKERLTLAAFYILAIRLRTFSSGDGTAQTD